MTCCLTARLRVEGSGLRVEGSGLRERRTQGGKRKHGVRLPLTRELAAKLTEGEKIRDDLDAEFRTLNGKKALTLVRP